MEPVHWHCHSHKHAGSTNASEHARAHEYGYPHSHADFGAFLNPNLHRYVHGYTYPAYAISDAYGVPRTDSSREQLEQ